MRLCSLRTVVSILCSGVSLAIEPLNCFEGIAFSGNCGKVTNLELLDAIEKDPDLKKNMEIQKAVSELRVLLRYCSLFGANNHIVLDRSLLPWFDYYSGIVFDVIFKGFAGRRFLNSSTANL